MKIEAAYPAGECDCKGPDIFTVGEEYTSDNGNIWLCIVKDSEYAWLRAAGRQDSEAYVWKLNGENVSQKVARGYDIQPEPIVETVIMKMFFKNGAAPYVSRGMSNPSHSLSFEIKDGEPDCSSIKMECIED